MHGNGKKTQTYENLECDLLPVDIVLHETFPDELQAIADKESEIEEAVSAMDQLKEEQPDAFTDDNDNNLTEAVLRKLVRERADDDYLKVWKSYLEQYDLKKALAKELKEMKADLTEMVKEEYDSFSACPDLLRAFVVDKKWLKTLRGKFYEEQDNAVLSIISRVQTLHDRYADTLPQLEANEKQLEKEVGECLEQMGYQL